MEAFVLSHLGLGDNILLIGAVRYIATQFSKVHVVCKKQNMKNIEIFYKDDDNIILYPVKSDIDISPAYGCPKNIFLEATQNKVVFLSGGHLLNKRPHSYKFLPFNFYIDMNIDPMHFWNSFSINIPIESQVLYKLLNKRPYIFVHNTCSQGKVFNVEEIAKKLDFNKNDTLVINPCSNMYNENHPYFKIANKFINHKLPDYIDTIINASKIILTDSSFWCLSMNLSIKTTECYLYSRDNVRYRHIWDCSVKYPGHIRKFINFNP